MVRRKQCEPQDILLQAEKAQRGNLAAGRARKVAVRECVEETKSPNANTGVIRITGRGITAELPQDISPKLLMVLLKGPSSC